MNRAKFIGWTILTVLILGTGSAIYLTWQLDRPAEGVIVPAQQAAAGAAKAAPAPLKFSGAYVSFTLPDSYEKLSTSLSGTYLEIAGYYATDHSNKHVSVGVLRETLADDSGFSYRQTHSDLYRQQPDSSYGPTFIKDGPDGSETTAYLTHDGLVATVSISCPFQADLSDDLVTVLRSFSWVKH